MAVVDGFMTVAKDSRRSENLGARRSERDGKFFKDEEAWLRASPMLDIAQVRPGD